MPLASFMGNTARILAALNSVVFTLAALFRHPNLDPLWNEQGFCIMNPEHRYATSHDFCLYVGLILAGILDVVVYLLKEEPGMQLATDIVAPKTKMLYGHACAHGILAQGLRFGLLSNHVISVYIPCLLYLFYNWKEFQTPAKGFEYALFPWLVEIPLGAVAWIEGIQCSAWVIRVWGHLIYDVYLALSMMFFYMICWVRASLIAEKKKYKAS